MASQDDVSETGSESNESDSDIFDADESGAAVEVIQISDEEEAEASDHRSQQEEGPDTLRTEGLSNTNTGDTQATSVQPSENAGAPSASHAAQSPEDFQKAKRRRLSSPQKSATGGASSEDDDDGKCCPICFESWTNSGSHRLASLRCGHLFGQSCIEKWLKGQGGKCPHCNAKASKKDIRVIYAKAIKTTDTTERDRALAELETERVARRKAEMEAAQARLRHQMAVDECTRLKQELERHKQQSEHNRSMQLTNTTVQLAQATVNTNPNHGYVFDRIVKICELGQCRVMAHTPDAASLCVSQPSSSPIFPGFGVKKLNVLDWRSSQYVSLHSKAIRDMAFNPASRNPLLLSCSIDKTVKVTNLLSNSTVQTFSVSLPVWSCTWNHDDTNIFYCGFPNGTVNVYDLRNTSEHVCQLNAQGSRSPVVSLQYMPYYQQASFRPGGLIVGQLEQCIFYERQVSGEYKLHALLAEVSLTCLSVDARTRLMGASYRPSSRHPAVRHLIHEMCQCPDDVAGETSSSCKLNTVFTLQGGQSQTLLSRSRIMTRPPHTDQLLFAAGEESSATVNIWDVSTGQLAQKLPSQNSPVLDLCPVEVNNNHFLITLMDKQIALYKWR